MLERTRAIVLCASIALTTAAQAEDGFGTVKFTVEVTGTHNVPHADGGFRNTKKSRVFRGQARLKYVGGGFAVPAARGYDRASFERQKDACEQASSDENDIETCQDEVQKEQNAAERASLQGNVAGSAMNAARTDVWANDRCFGEIEVADKGKYRRLNPHEGGMREVPTSVTAKHVVEADAAGGDGCSFSLVYNPANQTVEINVDPGPLRMAVTETTNVSAVKTHINPFAWSALRKFEKANVKVSGTRNGHSGSWSEDGGSPVELAGQARVSGEFVETSTRITWHFTGEPAATKGRAPQAVPQDNDPLGGCLQEEKQAGREPPDPLKLMECVEKKSNGKR
jgi:hypothetical protein